MSRSLQHWVAFFLSMLAVLAVAVGVQSFAELLNRRIDLTARQDLTLSEYTRSVLAQLEEPLKIVYYYERDKRHRIREMLDLMRVQAPLLSFEMVDLDRNPARAKDDGVDHYDRAVLTYQGRRQVVSAGNERALAAAIYRVMQSKPLIVYFLTGHGERTLNLGRDDQLARAAQVLRSEGYDLRVLGLLAQPEVPADATAVVIAGPENDMVESEVRALDTYLARGGSILVLVDPVQLPGLERWLATYGFQLADDVVIDTSNRVYGSDGTNVVVPYYRDHPVTKYLKAAAVLGRARSVGLVGPDGAEAAKDASIVARTASESFRAVGAGRTRAGAVEFDASRDERGPVGVMGVREVGQTAKTAGRLVVIGDADFASDQFLTLLGNRDLLLDALAWLAHDDEEGSGPEAGAIVRPQEETSSLGPMSPVVISEGLARTILIVLALVQPAIILGIGILVVARRRGRR